MDCNKTQLAQHLHECACSPVISTFQQYIKNGNVVTWRGIDDVNFRKLIDHTEATIIGYLDQERKNMQSTKQSPTVPVEAPSDMTYTSFSPQIMTKMQNCFYVIFDLAQATKIYTNLTGCFPH